MPYRVRWRAINRSTMRLSRVWSGHLRGPLQTLKEARQQLREEVTWMWENKDETILPVPEITWHVALLKCDTIKPGEIINVGGWPH